MDRAMNKRQGRAYRQLTTTVAGADMNKQPDFSRDENDRISAMADGALQGDAFAAAMDSLARDDDARARWHAYHVVGDVLRSDALAGAAGDMAFLARLEARLAQETDTPRVASPPQVHPMPVLRPAANHDVFRWKIAAGFASLAAVAAIGWQGLQGFDGRGAGGGAVLAQSQAPLAVDGFQSVRADVPMVPDALFTLPAAEAPQVMLRNAQLDELLAAHSRAVGGAALQSQSRLVRNVSVSDEPAR